MSRKIVLFSLGLSHSRSTNSIVCSEFVEVGWIGTGKWLKNTHSSRYAKGYVLHCNMMPHLILILESASIGWLSSFLPPHLCWLPKHGISEMSVCVKISSGLCHIQSPLLLHKDSRAPPSLGSGDRSAFMSDINLQCGGQRGCEGGGPEWCLRIEP